MKKKQEKVIVEIPVLWNGWDGWECDHTAWIIERQDGTRYIRMTSQGSPYEAKSGELEERIKEYESVIQKTRDALSLISG